MTGEPREVVDDRLVEPLSLYWGKARPAPDSGGPEWHPFALHSLDVAATALAWLKQSQTLRRLFGVGELLPTDPALAWLLYFIALHDLGKLDLRFQYKAKDVVVAIGWPGDQGLDANSRDFDHGRAGLGWFHRERAALGEFESASYAQLGWVESVTSHHGTLSIRFSVPRDSSGFGPLHLIRQDRDARITWIRVLESIFLEPAGLTLEDRPPPPSPALSGFCSICDWIGSDTEFFPYTSPKGVGLRSYFTKRCGQDYAVRALAASGLICSAPSESGMSAIFPNRSPRGVQRCVDEVPMVPGLVIMEGPTGSGKTEAAIALASRYLADGLAESIIFALPTQATANQMFDRIVDAVERLFPHSPPTVVLAHGKARFNETFQRLKDTSRPDTFQKQQDAWAQCKKWTASSRKRVFLGQVGVCTVDQVLMSVLPVRHNFVRGFGVLRSVLIVDEVHAYDTYMNRLLDTVLDCQQRAGGVAVLLSATLPSARRNQLVNRWARVDSTSEERPVEVPYPLVTVATPRGIERLEPSPPSDDEQGSRRVRFECVEAPEARPPDELLDRVVESAASGARVAIVCNLVADAQRIARVLRSKAEADLFHSRFQFGHRLAIEQEVIRNYGAAAVPGRGRILVATQVIEQSLDIDFDWLITQVCPVELLFQRIGRLHRFDLKLRPLGDGICCTVVVPPGDVFGGHGFVYENLRSLWRTRELVRGGTTLEFPAAYRAEIERAFDVEPWVGEPASITVAFQKYEDECASKDYRAKFLSSGGIAPFADTDGNAATLTRDSEPSLTIVPIRADAGGARVLLDGDRLDGLDDWEADRRRDLASIRVTKSWRPLLPPPVEETFYLPMVQEGELWTSRLGDILVTYSTEYGLERSDR